MGNVLMIERERDTATNPAGLLTYVDRLGIAKPCVPAEEYFQASTSVKLELKVSSLRTSVLDSARTPQAVQIDPETSATNSTAFSWQA